MGLKIVPESHLDHDVPPALIEQLPRMFADADGFFIKAILSPVPLPCKLHGPAVGEPPVEESEVRYEVRGSRPGASRICDRPAAMTNVVTVIAGPHGNKPCVLYTCFPGPSTPKEPTDPTLKDSERAESEAFWAEHALSL